MGELASHTRADCWLAGTSFYHRVTLHLFQEPEKQISSYMFWAKPRLWMEPALSWNDLCPILMWWYQTRDSSLVQKDLDPGGQFSVYAPVTGTLKDRGHGDSQVLTASKILRLLASLSQNVSGFQLILRPMFPPFRFVALLGPVGTFKQWKEINCSAKRHFGCHPRSNGFFHL